MPNDIPTAPAPLPTVRPVSLFQALGNETRLAMIRRLAAGGTLSVNDFVPASGMSQAGVSKHLELLRQAGVVVKAPSPDGDLRKHCYQIPPSFLVARSGLIELDCGMCVMRLDLPAATA
jgi:DNA-binding transcriptional ArsR family regulator